MRAGMVVSTATTITVPATTAIGHQADGWLALPSWLATVDSQNPAGDAEQGAHKRGNDLRHVTWPDPWAREFAELSPRSWVKRKKRQRRGRRIT